jgi:hypothetical protein
MSKTGLKQSEDIFNGNILSHQYFLNTGFGTNLLNEFDLLGINIVAILL